MFLALFFVFLLLSIMFYAVILFLYKVKKGSTKIAAISKEELLAFFPSPHLLARKSFCYQQKSWLQVYQSLAASDTLINGDFSQAVILADSSWSVSSNFILVIMDLMRRCHLFTWCGKIFCRDQIYLLKLALFPGKNTAESKFYLLIRGMSANGQQELKASRIDNKPCIFISRADGYTEELRYVDDNTLLGFVFKNATTKKVEISYLLAK